MEAVGVEEKQFECSQHQIRIQRDLFPILKLRGKERMDAIPSSDNPQEIFQSLPEEEVYFSIKEIGEQDALPLLSLMSPRQCQYLLDLELWKGYEVQLELAIAKSGFKPEHETLLLKEIATLVLEEIGP